MNPHCLEHCFRLSYQRKVPSFQESVDKIKSRWLRCGKESLTRNVDDLLPGTPRTKPGLVLSQHGGGGGVVSQGNFFQIEKLSGRNK